VASSFSEPLWRYLVTRKKFWELMFADRDEPLPTVEVDTKGKYLVASACGDAIVSVLKSLGNKQRVTVYTYESPSFNFGPVTNSIFYAVAGPERVLQALHGAIKAVPGTEVRYSEQIPSASCVRRYHIENGVVWRVDDDDEWVSVD
jgi:hypothetical protein